MVNFSKKTPMASSMNSTGGASFFKVYQNPETDEITLRAKFVFNTNYVWPELFSVGL